MTNQSLSDDDHISRYCKPSAIDESGRPMANAFSLRQGENHLSVNWLEYFNETELNAAVERVREVFHSKGFTLRPNGRFAVLNVEAAKTAVHEAVGRTLNIDHLPLSDDPSHSGILGYSSEDLAVAVELAALITPQDIHQAVP